MRTSYSFFAVLPLVCIQSLLGQEPTPTPGSGDATVIERGPHHAVYQSVLADGTTNSFTLLETGIHRWSKTDGGWIPAVAAIETVNGAIVARQTQHQVVFGESANSKDGTIDLLMVNGARFRVRPIGIAYTEFKNGQPGKSVFIEQLQDSKAELTGSAQVTYFGALGSADLCYDVTLAGLEQNVVFRERLPAPNDLQMDADLVRVECWSEVLESPAPSVKTTAVVRSDGTQDGDVQLDFGPMQINAGRVFSAGASTPAHSARVAKQWQNVDGLTCLIESVPYSELTPLMEKLPARLANRSVDQTRLFEFWAKHSGTLRARPASLSQLWSAQSSPAKGSRVAAAPDGRSAPAVWLDWSLLSSAANVTLKGDTTYYVNGTVNLSSSGNGSTLIEGGVVVKFTNNPTAKIVSDRLLRVRN